MARTQDDEKMLEAARGGDRESIVSLLVVAQPDLRRYAAQACRASDDVNDAVQEALWIVYRRIGALRAFASMAKAAGATLEEVTEVVFLTAAIKAGAAVGHSQMVMRMYSEAPSPAAPTEATRDATS